jgi:N-acetylmuramoyl-L-alanine amidase
MGIKIMLDAGHGMHTSGKRTPDGMREFEFNRMVAGYINAILQHYEGVYLKFAHDPTGERDIPLEERTDKSNYWGADVYASIHANAIGRGGWRDDAEGIETFTYGGGSKSKALQDATHGRLVEATGLKDRGKKQANFHVLRETKDCASVLYECGFMTNRNEAKLLRSDAFRRKCAQAIAEGIISCYGLKRKPEPKPKVTDKGDGTFYRVVTGSFDAKENAEERVAELKAKGYESFILPYKK